MPAYLNNNQLTMYVLNDFAGETMSCDGGNHFGYTVTPDDMPVRHRLSE